MEGPEDVRDAPKDPEFKPFDRVLVRLVNRLILAPLILLKGGRYRKEFTMIGKKVSKS